MTRAKYVAYWLPSTFAILFMSGSGIFMLNAIQGTKRVTETNLYQTCLNADKIRTPQEASRCWEDYTRITGRKEGT